MKKMVLGFSMILACLIFLVPPAAAANPSPPPSVPSLSAFLASLAPVPVAAAKRPAVREKSLCTATANCVAGGTVSCSSNINASNCSAVDYDCSVNEPGHVTCDGVTTWCTPNTCQTCPADWCTSESDCASQCAPCPYTYTCNETLCTEHCRCNFSQCPP